MIQNGIMFFQKPKPVNYIDVKKNRNCVKIYNFITVTIIIQTQ
jgi:hypothetical protein